VDGEDTDQAGQGQDMLHRPAPSPLPRFTSSTPMGEHE
jgi:hypothetical protein